MGNHLHTQNVFDGNLLGVRTDALSRQPACQFGQHILSGLALGHGRIGFDEVARQNSSAAMQGDGVGLDHAGGSRRTLRLSMWATWRCRKQRFNRHILSEIRHRTGANSTTNHLHILTPTHHKSETPHQMWSDVDDDMTDRRRSYIDPETHEFLLLEWNTQCDGWHPAMPTLQSWQRGLTRIYRPSDRPTTLITYPGHIAWPLLTASEEPDIRNLLEHPWIQSTFAIDGFREEQIDCADAIQQFELLDPGPAVDHDLAAAILASMSSVHREANTREGRSKATPQPFPKHLVTQILTKAETDNQLCAITMEPISAATATITSCGHIFQKAAITHWLSDHTTCPECRQPCSLP